MTRSISFLLLLILCLPGPALSQGTAPRTITLVEAINIALQNNPSIEEAKAGREGALADIRGVQADFLQKASTQYSYTRLAEQPFQRVNGLERFIGDENAHHWDISLTQPLFTGFALTSKKKMTEIAAEIQEIESERVAINVSQDLRIAWFETLFSQRLGQVAEENTTALTAHLKTAQGFYDQGLISRNDLLKAEVALAQARQDKERATADIDIARSRLATILGIEIPQSDLLEDINSIEPAPLLLTELTGEALLNNPVLKSYRLGLSQYDNSIKLAGSTAYPTVALVGKYEQNGNDLGAESNSYTNERNAALVLTAQWDFYDWGKTSAAVAKQQSEKKALAERVRAMEDQIRLEVKRAYLDLHVAETNISTARQGLVQAKENWRITELQYQNQVATSTDVLDSRTLLIQAESNSFRALYGYRIALARLERAVGRR